MEVGEWSILFNEREDESVSFLSESKPTVARCWSRSMVEEENEPYGVVDLPNKIECDYDHNWTAHDAIDYGHLLYPTHLLVKDNMFVLYGCDRFVPTKLNYL